MEYTHLGRTGLLVSRLCLGTMNFGPLTTENPTRTRSWTRRTSTASTSSTPPTSTAATRARARPRRSSADWFAKGGGRRERTVLATKLYGDMGDWPNERQAVGAQHPPRARRQPQAAADRLHRPLPVPPRRPRDSLGRDLAGDRGRRPAGQDPLRRQQQLRRLAHRPGPGGRGAPHLHRAGQRAVDLQPDDPRRRARGAAGGAALRHRGHPLVAAAGRAARRACCARSARAGAAWRAARPTTVAQNRARRSRSTRTSAAELGHEPGDVALALAAAPARASPRRSSARAPGAAGLRRSVRSTSSSRGGAGPAGRDLPGPQNRARALRLVGRRQAGESRLPITRPLPDRFRDMGSRWER